MMHLSLANTTAMPYIQNPKVIISMASNIVAAIFGAAVALTDAP
jgi:hypothetical protein